MCDHFQCDHLGNKPVVLSPEVVAAEVREIMNRYVGERDLPATQAAVDQILTKYGIPPGSIIVVDDQPFSTTSQLPSDLVSSLLTPEAIESMKPQRLHIHTDDAFDFLKTFEMPDPDTLAVHSWDINFRETDCGHACTPDGCMGHDSEVPDQLIIGNTVLTFGEDLDDPTSCRQAIQVGRFLVKMIKDAQARRAQAEVTAGQIQAGAVDLGAKTIVRGHEALLDKIEEGYRLFGDIHNPGIKFLRASGMPDLLYYDV